MYERFAGLLALSTYFFIPLKLSLAYASLIPLVLLTLLHHRGNFGRFLFQAREILAPLLAFVAVGVVGSIFSLDAGRSLHSLASLAFVVMLIPAVHALISEKKFSIEKGLWVILCSQTIAALYSVAEGAFPAEVPHIFIGRVTESGQLALVIFAAVALLSLRPLKTIALQRNLRVLIVATTIFLSSICAGFYPFLPINNAQLYGIFALLGLALACALMLVKSSTNGNRLPLTLFCIALPLLSAALLVNLKRGPWLGVTVGALCFLCVYRKRLLLPFAFGIVMVLCLFEPVRTRLAHSEQHFFISGGRNAIWQIGEDLALRYPMGVGFQNSGVLRQFSAEIPEDLKHFHNNLLNVLVETGWPGLATYLWWIASLLSAAFSAGRKPATRAAARALGCGVIAWQVAGLVEYNFGDSEVLIIAFLFAGMLSAIKQGAVEESETQTATAIVNQVAQGM